ncbi:MAG: nitroreductase family protein [Prevotellaceae bacterium]|jgi:nitroreductase|nr:nitroreductase family protein [Prevotellaceae bacterium]
MRDTLTVISQRKSVRHFTDREISDGQVEVLLRAAMAAPSAKNKQVWEFVVINERSELDRLATLLPYAKMLSQAPVAIVICGDVSKNTEESELNWVADCSAAAENLLLAAESLGLGAVWTAAFPYADRMDAVRQITGIPEHIVPLCVVPVGHPGKDEPVKDKWHPEKIHYNQW